VPSRFFPFASNDRIFLLHAAASTMQFPFGVRSRDVDQLRQTLPHLGPSSSLSGIAAALSWNERRVERTVREWERLEPMRVAYDPLSRSVRLLGVAAVVPPAPLPPPPPVAAPAPSPAADLPRSWGGGVNCRSCGTKMEPTGTGSGLFCPGCGRLASSHRSGTPPPLPVAAPAPPKPSTAPSLASPSPPGAPAVATGTGHAVSDRKAQEMFAAWATAQPIPCPRCRVPLRHNGVGQYRCPGCGETARFVGETGPTRPAAPTLAPPAA
jgi:predicted RNA-binding Zn-ribbon protein involved in translation (DUF1610 family)